MNIFLKLVLVDIKRYWVPQKPSVYNTTGKYKNGDTFVSINHFQPELWSSGWTSDHKKCIILGHFVLRTLWFLVIFVPKTGVFWKYIASNAMIGGLPHFCTATIYCWHVSVSCLLMHDAHDTWSSIPFLLRKLRANFLASTTPHANCSVFKLFTSDQQQCVSEYLEVWSINSVFGVLVQYFNLVTEMGQTRFWMGLKTKNKKLCNLRNSGKFKCILYS